MYTVLGATGVIGSRLVQALRAAGNTVIAPARGETGVFSRPLGHVIYAIGLTADFRQKPFDTVEAHVGVLGDVLRTASYDSLLYLSSTRVYSGAKSTQEDTALSVRPGDPSDLYNLSKLMGEALCHATGKPSVRVARLSNVVGGDDADSENFLPTLAREARAGRILLRSAPASAKDYIHIDDVVDLLPRIASFGRERVYNVASGIQIAHSEWTTLLQTTTGCRVETAPDAPLLHFMPIDNSRVRREFNYIPRSPFSCLEQYAAREGR